MRTLKFEGIAKVGDKIRAYDFEPMTGRPDCYIEGVVQEVLTYDSMRGRPIGTAVCVPMETGMDYDTRVQKISQVLCFELKFSLTSGPNFDILVLSEEIDEPEQDRKVDHGRD